MERLPVGFISLCLNCKSSQVKLEIRSDGIDFQCQTCGNKMFLRHGEAFQFQTPEGVIQKKVADFEQELDKPLQKEKITKKWIEGE